MSDVMSVRLHLSGVRVRGVLVDAVDRLEVEVESAREWSRCPHCGFRCVKVWDGRRKRIRDLEVSGRRTTLVWRRRRFVCSKLWGAAPRGAHPVRWWCRPPPRPPLGPGRPADVDSGGVSPSWGGLASDHGVGESPLRARSEASPGPPVSCVVGG